MLKESVGILVMITTIMLGVIIVGLGLGLACGAAFGAITRTFCVVAGVC